MHNFLISSKGTVNKCSTDQLFIGKITVMDIFCSNVACCDLNKKGLHHSFFWLNFVKFFRSCFYWNVLPWTNNSVPFRSLWDFNGVLKSTHSWSKIWQLPLHISTTIIILLTKQIQIPYMQLLEVVLWNSCPQQNCNKFQQTVAYQEQDEVKIWSFSCIISNCQKEVNSLVCNRGL